MREFDNRDYESLFINKGRLYNSSKSHKKTNSISLSISRPTHNIKFNRKFDLALNTSIQQHHIVDILATPRTTIYIEKNIVSNTNQSNYIYLFKFY